MPTYEYHCTNCNYTWEAQYKIVDRAKPEGEACPSCATLGYVEKRTFTAIPIGDPVRLGLRQPAGNVKEVLQKIQSRAPKSEIANYSNLTRL
jgi:putative FmdB family regulatory protein